MKCPARPAPRVSPVPPFSPSATPALAASLMELRSLLVLPTPYTLRSFALFVIILPIYMLNGKNFFDKHFCKLINNFNKNKTFLKKCHTTKKGKKRKYIAKVVTFFMSSKRPDTMKNFFIFSFATNFCSSYAPLYRICTLSCAA